MLLSTEVTLNSSAFSLAAELFSDRSSDSRINLILRLPNLKKVSGLSAEFVPGHSGGPVPELHRLPY